MAGMTFEKLLSAPDGTMKCHHRSGRRNIAPQHPHCTPTTPRYYPDCTGRKYPSFSIPPHTDIEPLFHYLDMQNPQVVYAFAPSKTGSKHAMNAMVCNGVQ